MLAHIVIAGGLLAGHSCQYMMDKKESTPVLTEPYEQLKQGERASRNKVRGGVQGQGPGRGGTGRGGQPFNGPYIED